MQHTMYIPRWRPPSLNDCRNRHWSVEARLKKQTTELLTTYAVMQRVPGATGKRRVSLVIILGPRHKANDRDNLDKCLLDSLKRSGLITDDGDRGLDGRVEIIWERGTQDTWGTMITLEDVP